MSAGNKLVPVRLPDYHAFPVSTIMLGGEIVPEEFWDGPIPLEAAPHVV